MVRASKCPYWKIYENEGKKTAGNFVVSADFDVADLGINAACDDLQAKLANLSQGRYILTAYEENGGKRKGIDTWIELEPLSNHATQGIGSTGHPAPPTFYIEGIGKVTPDNFEAAIEQKFALMLAKQKKEEEEKALRVRVVELERELRSQDTAVNRGLMSIGTVAYAHMSKTPAFKEMMSTVGSVMAGAAAGETAGIQGIDDAQLASTPTLPDNHVEGDTAEIGGVRVSQDRLFAALDKLGTNNPEVLKHIELLAGLKENDPGTYEMAVSFAESKM